MHETQVATAARLEAVYASLARNPALAAAVPHNLAGLLEHGILHPVQAGQPFVPPSADPYVFVVLEGQLRLVTPGSLGEEEVELLREGDLFGDIPHLMDEDSTRLAVAQSPGILLALPAELSEQVLERYPGLLQAFLGRYRDRMLERALEAVPAFRSLPQDSLDWLRARSELQTFAPGEVLVAQGQPGDAFYVIYRGLAMVSRREDRASLNLAVLRPGDYFGEWALLTGSARLATVSALTPLWAAGFCRDVFLEFLQQHPPVHQRIAQVARERHSQTSAYGEQLASLASVEGLIARLRQALT